MHLRYCMYSADKHGGGHPQEVMKNLGISYQHATPQRMGDQWWFWNCKDLPEVLPEYLEKLEIDPMKTIGWGLDQTMAEAIRDAS